MVEVIFIGTDRLVFKEDSRVYKRMQDYANLFDFTANVVLSKKGQIGDGEGGARLVGEKLLLISTNSFLKIFAPFSAVFIALGIIKEHGGNDFIISAQDPFECGISAWLVSLFSKSKLQIQIHTDFLSRGFAEASFLNKIRFKIARFVLPRADSIRVVSSRISDSLLKTTNYKLKTNPIVLPIFSDFEELERNMKPVDYREIFPKKDFIFITLSRLEKEKNIDFIISVFSDFVRKYPDTALVVVGSGSQSLALKGLVKKFGIEESVHFSGYVKNSLSSFKNANAFIQASSFEGYGMSLAEAVYMGLPFVSTNVGNAEDFIEKGARGELCETTDEKCFFEKMEVVYRQRVKYSINKNVFLSKDEYLKRFKEGIEGGLR